jgi:hemerythrin-like domain-containing protein
MLINLFDPDGTANDELKCCLSRLRAHHKVKLQLCDALEDLADTLPDQLDVQSCLTLSRCIIPTVRQAQMMEETQFFPLLASMFQHDKHVQASLDRLRHEHFEDDSYAEEIAALLQTCGEVGKSTNAEAAGYMLRGFFTSIRRHVAFERECLVPLVEQRISD